MDTPTQNNIEEKQTVYSIKVDTGNAVVTSEGTSFEEALKNMERPVKVLGISTVTISDGTREKVLLFPPVRTKRLFYSISQGFMARQLQLLFK